MINQPEFSTHIVDEDWGCEYLKAESEKYAGKVKICYVKVTDLVKVSEELASSVLDTSWMMDLDAGSRRAYDKTVKETAAELVEVFQHTAENSEVGAEFGEIMVSIGSSKALAEIFDHVVLPIAELWKPQKKQNEGFDFHTVCKKQFINFGEAKYSSVKNPHGDAIDQAKGFIDQEKHLRDRVHLINLVSEDAIDNLDHDSYGVVASFSINTPDPLAVLKNAIMTAESKLDSDLIKSVYLVGVGK